MLKVTHCMPAPFDGSLLSFIAWLRWTDTRWPISASLSVTGIVLVVLGVGCGAYSMVSAHPWVAAVLAGLACLAVAALSHHGGLVTFLPLSVQDLLLRNTPFDLLFDDTEAQNMARRWGRLLLLCTPRSEEEIQTILRGLDYEFLDKVFRRGMVHMLPSICRSLLLPNLLQPVQTNVIPRRASMEEGSWWVGGLGSLMAKYVRVPSKSNGEVRQFDLSPAGIHKLLCQKAEEKRRLATEPALTPVLCKLVPNAVKQVASQSLQLAAVASVASSGAWITSALFFCTPSARNTLRLYAFGGQASASSGERASRAALIATGLSLLGAGTSLAFALHIHQRWLPRTLLQTTSVEVHAGEGERDRSAMCGRCNRSEPRVMPGHIVRVPLALVEPETEVSPDDSSVEEDHPVGQTS